MHVACVTKQTYDSMHKPTVEQLFQVSQALSCLASSLAEWLLVPWCLPVCCHSGSRRGAWDLAVVALAVCTYSSDSGELLP